MLHMSDEHCYGLRLWYDVECNDDVIFHNVTIYVDKSNLSTQDITILHFTLVSMKCNNFVSCNSF